jgi:hypothetical protein
MKRSPQGGPPGTGHTAESLFGKPMPCLLDKFSPDWYTNGCSDIDSAAFCFELSVTQCALDMLQFTAQSLSDGNQICTV